MSSPTGARGLPEGRTVIDELDDFLNHCRVERRLAPLTCSAYERDVRACLAFLAGEGIGSWAEVRPAAPAPLPRRGGRRADRHSRARRERSRR